MRVDRPPGGGHFAEFEEVDDPPVHALQFRLTIAGRTPGVDELVGDGEALLDVGWAPERHVARVQRLE